MNGWQRLGVVISSLVAVPSALIGYSEKDSAYVYVYPSAATLALGEQAYIDKVYWDAVGRNPVLKACILESASVSRPTEYSGAIVSCDRKPIIAFLDTIPYVAIPFLIVFGIGYVCAWVFRGFKPKPA